MRTFLCGRCSSPVFFENTVCVRCGVMLGFVPGELDMAAFEAGADGRWVRQGGGAGEGSHWKPCRNYSERQRCNWMIPADEEDADFCLSCRHSEATEATADPACDELVRRLETAKRRLFHSLLRLGLPLLDQPGRREPLFRFLSRKHIGGAVTTGYADGVITVDVMEANDACREARRVGLGEPYRTLLGHFRHESGHYYWDRILSGGPRLNDFRALFGDERRDYAEALRDHYDEGPAPDWSERYISAYASVHPWEDWAESFAHYLHVSDALDTAAHWGFSLRPGVVTGGGSVEAAACSDERPFRDVLVEHWLPLSQFLNSMGRSLGHGDAYPFIAASPVLDKLCFVHDFVCASAQQPDAIRRCA